MDTKFRSFETLQHITLSGRAQAPLFLSSRKCQPVSTDRREGLSPSAGL